MTSAHRPTFNPAIGRAPTAVASSVSAKDGGLMPMKTRQDSQSIEASRKNLKEELKRKEREASEKKGKPSRRDGDDSESQNSSLPEPKRSRISAETAKQDADLPTIADDDDDDDDDEDNKGKGKGKGKDNDDDDNGDDDDDDDDEDDDTAELLRELEKIKKERAEEQQRVAKQKAEEEDRIRTEQVLTGNPLLNRPEDFAIKKRWNDDAVFKNCAKSEPEAKKRFINDTLRSDFHKRFLGKYIR